MALPVRAQLENEAIRLLSDLQASGRVRTVRAYMGELARPKIEDVLQALNGQTPGILVTTESGRYRPIQVQKQRYYRDIELVLYVVSTTQSTRPERVRGQGQIYELEDATLERLTGKKPSLVGGAAAAGHFEPVAEELLAHDAVACIWKMTWKITVDCQLKAPPAPAITEVLGDVNFPSEDDNAKDPIVQVQTLITPT